MPPGKWRVLPQCSLERIPSTSWSGHFIFSVAQQPPSGPRPPHWRGFTITLRHTTLGQTPLEEWLARRTDLYPKSTQQTDRHPRLWRDSKPHPQQASGGRPTPQTGRPLGLDLSNQNSLILLHFEPQVLSYRQYRKVKYKETNKQIKRNDAKNL